MPVDNVSDRNATIDTNVGAAVTPCGGRPEVVSSQARPNGGSLSPPALCAARAFCRSARTALGAGDLGEDRALRCMCVLGHARRSDRGVRQVASRERIGTGFFVCARIAHGC